VSGPWQAFFKEYDTLFPPTHHAPAIEETGVLGLLCPTYFRSACTTDGNDRWFSKSSPGDTHLPNLPLNADGPRLNPPHGRLFTICGSTQILLNTDGIVAAISRKRHKKSKQNTRGRLEKEFHLYAETGLAKIPDKRYR
jgi:hypothetical protein